MFLLRSNRSKILFIGLILSLSIIFSGCSDKANGLVAKVNGDEITVEEFEHEFEILKKVRQKQFGEDILKKEIDGKKYEDNLRDEVFNMLVDEKIIEQDLERLEIPITDEEVDVEKDAMEKFYIEELGGEEAYENFLEENGFSEDYIRGNIKRELRLDKHRKDFLNKIHLKDEEIEEYYKGHKDEIKKPKVMHVLLDSKEEAERCLTALSNGGIFQDLAKERSIDRQTGEKGGLLGYVSPGDLTERELPELEEIAFQLKVGEYSGIIETRLGYHIVYVDDIKESLEDLRQDVIRNLKYERYTEKLKDLKDKADVKIYKKEFKR